MSYEMASDEENRAPGVYSFDNTGNSVPRKNTRVSEGDLDT